MVHEVSWLDESLLRRPAQEDRRNPPAGRDTKSEAARSFGVSRSSVKRYAKLAEEGHSLAPKKRPAPSQRWTKVPGGCWKLTPRRTPRGHPLRASGVLEAGSRSLGQRVHCEQDGQAPGMEPKKDRWERTSEMSS
jgi:hypothetical protein